MIYYWNKWKTEKASKPPRKSQNQHFLFSFKFSFVQFQVFLTAWFPLYSTFPLPCWAPRNAGWSFCATPSISQRFSKAAVFVWGPKLLPAKLGEKPGAGGTHCTPEGLLGSTPEHINSNFWVNNDVLQAHKTGSALVSVIWWVRPSVWNVTKRQKFQPLSAGTLGKKEITGREREKQGRLNRQKGGHGREAT